MVKNIEEVQQFGKENVDAAMKSFGACASALHLTLPAGYQLDRDEDQVHPGEGNATT